MNEDSKSNFNSDAIEDSDLQDEYDFSQAVRGKYKNRRHSSKATVTIQSDSDSRDVSIKTIEVTAIVPEDGKLTLQLPPEITPGTHRIVLLIEESNH
jgi:hypothetical protein